MTIGVFDFLHLRHEVGKVDQALGRISAGQDDVEVRCQGRITNPILLLREWGEDRSRN